ncbi:MAG: hypothetical protein V1714_05675 [Pseudomonadota bacterium]
MTPEQIRHEAEDQARREPLELLRAEVDKLAERKLDALALAGELWPVKKLLTGLDALTLEGALDYLKEKLKLKNPALKAIRAELKNGMGAASIETLEPDDRLHPAIDFQHGMMTLGFRVYTGQGDGLVLIVSDGERAEALLDTETVEIAGRSYRVNGIGAPARLGDTWGLDYLKKFIKIPTSPEGLFEGIKDAFRCYLDLPEDAYGLLAVWVVGTYWAILFSAFPFLHLYGPKETGKSKSLEALKHLCFNAEKARDITAAAMGDTLDAQRGTLLIDQAERLGKIENELNLVGLLADSYKKAGGRRRVVEMSNSGRRVLEFSTYGPKAFASTKDIDPDLRDRCVRIPMIRTRRRLPDLEGSELIWGELRDKLYRFALLNFKKAQYHYQAIPGDGTRAMELWRPLLAVARALGVSQGGIDALYEFYQEATRQTRHEPAPWEARLLEVLREKAKGETKFFEVGISELLTMMDIEGDQKPGAKWLGNTLSSFNLYLCKRRPKQEGKRGETVYLFDPSSLLDRCSLYLRDDEKLNGDTPQKDVAPAAPLNFNSNSNRLKGTQQKTGTCPPVAPEPLVDDMDTKGRTGTCPPKTLWPGQHFENIEKNDRGREGHENSGAMAKKISESGPLDPETDSLFVLAEQEPEPEPEPLDPELFGKPASEPGPLSDDEAKSLLKTLDPPLKPEKIGNIFDDWPQTRRKKSGRAMEVELP